jgi:release factor glutamine methyltransferase
VSAPGGELGTRVVLAHAVAALSAAGVGSPRVDAELLLAHTLGVSRGRLASLDQLEPGAATRFSELLARRAAREPLQYLLGSAPFRYLSVPVGPGVFIPRPETELLIDAVLPRLRAQDTPFVVDLCAGSGALALAVKHEIPDAEVLAVERSPAALTWLRSNCAGSGVQVLAADISDLLALESFAGRASAVVSNPPYVPAACVVSAEVGHDPAEAVFAGADGLDLIPAVLAAAALLLDTGGHLAMEHDDTQGVSVPTMLREDGRWDAIAEHRDLAGRDRYVTATRR